MAAVYVDEEEVWKCLKHPSKKRKSGICPVCLRERLAALCPDCANVRPCACCATATTSSSSSSSSSSRFPAGDGVRVAKLLESEPSFRRSRSVATAIPFLRSRSRFVGGGGFGDFASGDRSEPQSGRTKTPSFWSSMFRSSQRSKRSEPTVEQETSVAEVKKVQEEEEVEDEGAAMRRTMMMRSRSVAVPMMSSNSGAGGGKPSAKGRWYFPSPIKAFRHSKISKIVSERSPVYRG